MDADGSNVRQLTQLEPSSGAEDHAPSWSPDGSRIAFMRSNNTTEPVDASAIYTVGSDGQRPTARTAHATQLARGGRARLVA